MSDRDYRTVETADGLEVDCLHCTVMLPFTKHATVEEIRKAKLEHLRAHGPSIRKIDETLVAIDGANVYLEFLKGGQIQLAVSTLNGLGKPGAWVWKFDGTPENAEWLKARLVGAGPNGQVAEPLRSILNSFVPGR